MNGANKFILKVLGDGSLQATVTGGERVPFRYVTGRRAQLSVEARTSFYDLFKGIDPAVNAGLFSMLACVGLPQAFDRMVRLAGERLVGRLIGAALKIDYVEVRHRFGLAV